MRRIHIFIFIVIFKTASLYAETNIWTGAVDNSWYNKDNWSKKSIPKSTDEVIIPKVSTNRFPIFNGVAKIHKLSIQSRAKFKIDLSGILIVQNIHNKGIVLGKGTITIKACLENHGFINNNVVQVCSTCILNQKKQVIPIKH